MQQWWVVSLAPIETRGNSVGRNVPPARKGRVENFNQRPRRDETFPISKSRILGIGNSDSEWKILGIQKYFQKIPLFHNFAFAHRWKYHPLLISKTSFKRLWLIPVIAHNMQLQVKNLSWGKWKFYRKFGDLFRALFNIFSDFRPFEKLHDYTSIMHYGSWVCTAPSTDNIIDGNGFESFDGGDWKRYEFVNIFSHTNIFQVRYVDKWWPRSSNWSEGNQPVPNFRFDPDQRRLQL